MNTISLEAQQVRAALSAKGLETPMVPRVGTQDERRQKIEQHMKEVMTILGLDLSDDSLEEKSD